MADNIIPGSTNISVEFRVPTIVDITTMRIGSMRWTEGDGTSFAEIAAGSNLTALGTITTAHTDNAGIYLSVNTLVGNQYLVRADFPDAHFASGKDRVICTLYDGDLNIAAKEYTLEAAPATLANQINIESKIDDVPTVSEFNARTLTAASYGTATNQTNIETKVDDVPTNSEFNARTLVASGYGTATNQTNIENTVNDIPNTAEIAARTLTAGTYATLTKQNDQYTLTSNLLGAPYLLADGSTTSDITAMISEMAEQIAAGGTFSRGDHSLEALASKLDNVGLMSTAINKAATSLTLTTGSVGSGIIDNTQTIDGVYQILNDAAGSLEGYYEFNIGGNGIPVGGTWIGYLQSNNDDAILQGYHWGDTAFKQIAAISGQAGTGNSTIPFTLFPENVGTGVNIGKVRIGISGTGMTSANFATDQIFVSFGLNNQSGGYEGGKVWVKAGGVNGTELSVNGTVDNPVGSWADAQTIATNKNLSRFDIANGTTIVLDQDLLFTTVEGDAFNVDLNGWNIEGSKFEGAASITGEGLGGVLPPTFFGCGMGTVTLPPSAGFQCGFFGTFTMGSEGHYTWGGSATVLPSVIPAVFDFGLGLNASTFIIHSWGGGHLEIKNAGAGTGSYSFEMAGFGHLIVNANCSATTLVTISGVIDLTDNGTGITFDLGAQSIPTSIDNELTAQHDAGSWAPGGGGGSATEANQLAMIATLGTPANIDGGGATIADNIKKLADDGGGLNFDATTDSQEAIRNRGDSDWVTGGGGGGDATLANQNIILANQATIETKIDDKPSTAAVEARTLTSGTYATLQKQNDQYTLTDGIPNTAEINARTLLTASYGTAANQTTILSNQSDIETKVDDVKLDTAAILTNTGTTIPGLISVLNDLSDAEVWAFAVRTLTAGTNLNDLSASQVNTEVADVIKTDTTGEPGQGKPPEVTSLQEKIDYLYKFAINKMDQDADTKQVYNRAGTVVDHKSTVDYTSPTFTDGEMNAGP